MSDGPVTSPKVTPKRTRWTLFVPAPTDHSGRPQWLPEGNHPHSAAVWRHALHIAGARVGLTDAPMTTATFTVLPGSSIRPRAAYGPTLTALREALGAPGATTVGPVDPQQRPGVLIVVWSES